MIGICFILVIKVILFFNFEEWCVLLGNIIKFKLEFFKILIGVLIVLGLGFLWFIGNVFVCFKMKCKIGFLNNFFFVIKLNFLGLLVIVKYSGFYYVWCGVIKI